MGEHKQTIASTTGQRKAFLKAADGSLIMKESVSGGGLVFLVIPVAGSSTEWWKWEAVDENAL